MQIEVDYLGPSKPRYWPAPHAKLHELISAGKERYADRLKSFVQSVSDYVSIPLEDLLGKEDQWCDKLYALIAERGSLVWRV
jgi:hypothetical protein